MKKRLGIVVVCLLCVGCMSTLSSPVGSVYSTLDLSPNLAGWSVTTDVGSVTVHAGPLLVELGVDAATSDDWFAYELGPLKGH